MMRTRPSGLIAFGLAAAVLPLMAQVETEIQPVVPEARPVVVEHIMIHCSVLPEPSNVLV